MVVDGEEIGASAVVVAGGAWTRRLGKQLGVQLPVGPVRGQIAHLGVADHDTGSWPIVQQVYGHYMVPWADHRVAVGATVEEAGFAPDVTAGGVNEIMREALRVMPGLAGATLGEVRVGLRPTSLDDSPLIGPLPGVAGVFVATGHGANGLLLGPVSGKLMADVVLGRDPELDLTPFSPARFQNDQSDWSVLVSTGPRNRQSDWWVLCTRRPTTDQSDWSVVGGSQRSSLRARSAMMFFWTSVGPAPIVV